MGSIRCGDARADLVAVRELAAVADDAVLSAHVESERITKEREKIAAAKAEQDELVAQAERHRERVEQQQAEAAAAHDRRCAGQLAARAADLARYERRLVEINASNAKRTTAAAWLAKHCKKRRAPIFETKAYVDSKGFVKVGRIVSDYEEATVCPTTAPADVVEVAKLEKEGGVYVGAWPALDEPLVPLLYRAPDIDPGCLGEIRPAAPAPERVPSGL